MRKPAFGVSDQVRLKPACSATEEIFEFNKYKYYTMQAVNNKGSDQTVRMRRLICTFVVCMWHKLVFSSPELKAHR